LFTFFVQVVVRAAPQPLLSGNLTALTYDVWRAQVRGRPMIYFGRNEVEGGRQRLWVFATPRSVEDAMLWRNRRTRQAA
jgi:hypothetical protein